MTIKIIFPGVASCNVGVWGADGQVLAALGIEVPLARLQAEAEANIVRVLRYAARRLSDAMQARAMTMDNLPRHM